ncbi:MAG: gluconate kinase [Actinomycetia bacterium]|nr:gluconate kinase [Actinomycetes bacterium]
MSSTAIIVMGVSGSGKTTVGRVLAQRLGRPFLDADSLHSDAAKARMHRGEALTEAMREPWLDRVNAAIRASESEGIVVACSALTPGARARLERGLDSVRYVLLTGTPALLRDRLAHRKGHFAGPSLLHSQLETLDPPPDAIVVDVTPPPEAIVDQIVAALSSAS